MHIHLFVAINQCYFQNNVNAKFLNNKRAETDLTENKRNNICRGKRTVI